MLRRTAPRRGRAFALAVSILTSLFFFGCGAIGFISAPANGYVYGSGQPLHVAIVDETGPEWTPALEYSLREYETGAGGMLRFQRSTEGAHIKVVLRTYSDANPPTIEGYDFPQGAGGFATVYDAEGLACNYPPSSLPLNCSGEITNVTIWLNLAIPDGSDIEARRRRLILHELGHAFGLTRHSPALDIAALAQRYGWDLR